MHFTTPRPADKPKIGRKILRAALVMMLLGCLGVGFALAAGEAYCRLGHRCVTEGNYSFGGSLCRVKFSFPPAAGFLSVFPVGCGAVRHEYFAGKLLFRSEERMESAAYHYRFVPNGKSDEEKYGAMFFGCSFTFGSGVNDDESMPSVFARAAGDVQVRNFAQSGTGPASVLEALREGTPQLNAFPARGSRNYGFYGFIGHHALRMRGGHGAGCSWIGDLPRYRKDAQGNLRREGVLYDDCPFPRAPMKWLLENSQLFQYYNIYWFSLPTAEDLRFTADVILAARDAFRARFASENFFVVVYPSQDLPAWRDAILQRLRAAGVTVFDYHALLDFQQPQYFIPHNGHPTALTQRLIGEALARDFKAWRARHAGR